MSAITKSTGTCRQDRPSHPGRTPTSSQDGHYTTDEWTTGICRLNRLATNTPIRGQRQRPAHAAPHQPMQKCELTEINTAVSRREPPNGAQVPQTVLFAHGKLHDTLRRKDELQRPPGSSRSARMKPSSQDGHTKRPKAAGNTDAHYISASR